MFQNCTIKAIPKTAGKKQKLGTRWAKYLFSRCRLSASVPLRLLGIPGSAIIIFATIIIIITINIIITTATIIISTITIVTTNQLSAHLRQQVHASVSSGKGVSRRRVPASFKTRS